MKPSQGGTNSRLASLQSMSPKEGGANSRLISMQSVPPKEPEAPSVVTDTCLRPKCCDCAPTLFDAGRATPAFHPACALVLSSLEDSTWSGRWTLDESEKDQLLRHIEAGGGEGAYRDGRLSLGEIKGFLKNPANADLVRKLPSALSGLLIEEFVVRAFLDFDADNSGFLEKEEWNNFLDRLASLHLEYLLRLAFQAFRAFYGRGQPWRPCAQGSVQMLQKDLVDASGSLCIVQHQGSTAPLKGYSAGDIQRRPAPAFQVGYDPDAGPNPGWRSLPPGMWEDFWYYSANNHPIHGIFACDPIHRLSWVERIAMEVATLGFTFLTVHLKRRWVITGHAPASLLRHPFVFSAVVVSLPGIAIWWILFLLFTCPKFGAVDQAAANPLEIQRARMCSCIGDMVGYSLLVVLLTLFLLYPLMTASEGHWLEIVGGSIFGRVQGYIFTWLLMVFVYFNPVVAWGQPDPSKGFNLGDYIGLGQWRIEKQRFQTRCMDALDATFSMVDTPLALASAQDHSIAPCPGPSPIGLVCGSLCRKRDGAVEMRTGRSDKRVTYQEVSAVSEIIDEESDDEEADEKGGVRRWCACLLVAALALSLLVFLWARHAPQELEFLGVMPGRTPTAPALINASAPAPPQVVVVPAGSTTTPPRAAAGTPQGIGAGPPGGNTAARDPLPIAWPSACLASKPLPRSKRAWCCSTYGLLCSKGAVEPGRLGHTQEVKATSSAHHCSAGAVSEWTPAEREWCCKSYGRGCSRTAAARPAGPASAAVARTRAATTTAASNDADIEFNCSRSSYPSWTVDKKVWCCMKKSSACPSELIPDDTPPDALHARAPAASSSPPAPRTRTPPPPTTSAPFDCHAGFLNRVSGWSDAKKDWCCRNERLGCQVYTPSPRLGCNNPCSYSGYYSTCRGHIQYAAERWFAAKSNGCELAHYLIVKHCPACAACQRASAGCQMPP